MLYQLSLQVQLALRYFASGSPMRVIGDTMGYHIQCIKSLARNATTKNKIRDGFYDVAHFPGVVGTIDSTHVRDTGPSGDNEKFLNVVANWPGSCHDSFIFKTSNLGRYMETRHRGYDMDGVLLGDSGYPCKRYIVTPYLRPNSESQVRYNKAIRKTRAIVERCFDGGRGGLTSCMEIIKSRKSSKNYHCCAVLHNIALKLRNKWKMTIKK
ncbi:HARBI1 [Mytilus coruscus]|uniref:HARBI1 n=1 Tax=Mytilus coruscus TaxID=42192 RepID=A0A6J8DMT5_MYTCO|nr:HARBI1 [Mytilus coruscus]